MVTMEIRQKEEKRNKIIGYIATVVIHALLLLMLLWLMLTPPDPPIKYGGMELTMSLGEPDRGGPSPIPVEEPQPIVPTPVEQVEEQIATQDIEEAPSIKTTTKPKVETKPVKKVETPIEQPRKVDERALFKKKTTTDGSSGSGDGNIPGNEGSPDGSPGGSPNGNGFGDGQGGTGGGKGDGDGFGFDLKGRSINKRPQITDNSKETGKVVVHIVVDRTGRVIKAEPGQKGTNTSATALWEKAKQGALDTRFIPHPDGADEQHGTMTFIFKFKP